MALHDLNSLETKALEARGKKVLLGFFIIFALTGFGGYQLLCGSGQGDGLEKYSIDNIVDVREKEIASLLELVKVDDSDYKTHHQLGKLYFQLEEYQKSVQHLEKARRYAEQKNAPQREQYEILTDLALSYSKLGQFDKAIATLQQAKQIEPQKTLAYNQTGNNYDQQLKIQQARQEYLKAQQLDEKDSEAYKNLANQEFKKGNTEKGIEYLRQAVRKNPGNYQAFENLGDAYRRYRRFKEAEAAFKRAQALNPPGKWNKSRIYYKESRTQHGQGEEEERLATLKKALAINPDDPRVLKELGDIALAKGETRKALDYYRRAMARDSRNRELRDKYSNTLARYKNELHQQQLAANNGEGNGASGNGSGTGSSSGPGSGDGTGAGTGSGSGTGSGTGNTSGLLSDNKSDLNTRPGSGSGTGSGTGNSTGSGKATSDNSASFNRAINAGKSAFGKKNYAEAEKQFIAARNQNANDPQVDYLVARAQDKQGKGSEAEANYKKALQKDPTNTKAHYYLGILYYKKNKYINAAQSFKRAVAIDKEFTNAHYSVGLAYDRLGENKKAISAYKKALALKPGLYAGMVNLGVAYKRDGQYSNALAHLKKAQGIKPNDANVHYQVGEVYMRQNKNNLAEQSFNQALASNSNHYEARFNLGLLNIKRKSYTRAKEQFNKITSAKSDAASYYQLGKIAEAENNDSQALQHYQKAVAVNSKYYKGYINLGRIQAKLGQLSAAESSYNRALALSPQSFDASYNMANLYQRNNEHQQAITYYKKALALKPGHRPARLKYAETLEKTSAYNAAKRQYEVVLKQGNNKIALERLAFLYYRKLNNKPEALKTFQKILSVYPSHPKKSEYNEIVKLLKK